MSRGTIGRPMEILLVEDGLIDARLTIAALQKSGVKHRLTLTRDGAEAVRFLRREGQFTHVPRPDLILLDLHLPKKDGREVLDDLRADPELKHIPVVVLTASDDPEDKHKSELLNVDSYMTKPVDFDKFLEVIRQLRKFWLADIVLPRME
ncbi:MAG TPA: response regulator [Pirellulales bacterium]|jgi:CheY-like chemotaxis protein|nr:response regulator [Pirellulales bacterium]